MLPRLTVGSVVIAMKNSLSFSKIPCSSKILFSGESYEFLSGAIKIFAFLPSINIYFSSFGCK
ncbi:unnamed protein product [marine sediment metagenome]|uniref:Uncharacterized protein n=1 Tax=marine sediment metagenome TaxID=412755 RepID=X0ZDK6_9ZZZZ